MAKSRHVRLFVNVAERHWLDAQYLRADKREVSVAYLAGYVVECLLKALMLSMVSDHQQKAVLGEFRGQWVHDFELLRRKYAALGGARIPTKVNTAFELIRTWNTQMRYNPGNRFDGDFESFIDAVAMIRDWALPRI
jgi:hypothetical protein